MLTGLSEESIKMQLQSQKDDGWKKFTSEIDNPSDVSKLIRSLFC